MMLSWSMAEGDAISGNSLTGVGDYFQHIQSGIKFLFNVFDVGNKM